MENMEVLSFLCNGRIEELKNKLMDDVFKERPVDKKRWRAIRDFYKYERKDAEPFDKAPSRILWQGIPYTVITDSWVLILTKDDAGEIPLYDAEQPFPDVLNLFDIELLDTAPVDFKAVLEIAKEEGYKPLKKEMVSSSDFEYVWKFGSQYFMMGLIDKAVSVLDNGSEFMVYFDYDSFKSPIRIENEIGIAFICPQACDPKYHTDRKIVETSLN